MATPPMVILARYAFQPVRDLLPFAPFMLIGAATTFVEAGALVNRFVRTPLLVQRAASFGLALVCCLAPLRWTRILLVRDLHAVDTRTTAVRWLGTHIGPADRVLVAQELAFLPSELSKLCASVEVSSQRRPADVRTYDWVVSGDLNAGFPAPWTGALADRQETFTVGTYPMSGENLRIAGAPLENIWHSRTERIYVFGPLQPRDTTRRETCTRS